MTNQSTWEPPESEVITPNYGFPPAFTPVTHAPVPAPQFHPAPQNTIQTTSSGAPFSQTGFSTQPAQFSPTTSTPQQSQFSTFPSQASANFATQPQQFTPTNRFSTQSPATYAPQPRQIARISTFSSQSPSISPSSDIQWESCEPDYNSTRRKSLFSIPKSFNPPNIDTTAIKNGAKKAGQASLKGLKNNRKIIGVGAKFANAVLRETTGVSIPGTGLIAGGGGDDGDDDDEGVFAVVGAMGSMMGGGDDDCGVDIDIDESCEVDEVSLDDDGTINVDCEEGDIYEDQESVEYVDYQQQTMQPIMVQQAQPAPRRPQNRRKRPVNNAQRPSQGGNDSKPAGQGGQKVKRPQQSRPDPSTAKPTKQRPSTTPLQQKINPQPNATSNNQPRKRRPQPPTKQTQPSQGQAPQNQKVRRPRPGQTQQRPQAAAQASSSNQMLGSGSDITNSLMRAAVQGVSKTATRELSRGLIGMFTDDDFEGASDNDDYDDDIYDCSDGAEYEEDVEYYEEEDEYEEDYENDEVEVYEQQEETVYEQEIDQTATMNENTTVCEEATFSQPEFQVDYSTFEGYGGFYGDSTSFTVPEDVEQTTSAEVFAIETTQNSETIQQDLVIDEAYTVENIETTETFQQPVSTGDNYISQDVQVSETFQQETIVEETYATNNFQSSEIVQQEIIQEESTYVEVDQTTSQSAIENPQQDSETVPVETFESWNSAPSPPEPSPWAQESAMLEENVWAAEPANIPAEENVWAETETCAIVNETTQQSSFQEDVIYNETAITQENVVQQETLTVESTDYAESTVTVSQDFSQEAVICNESAVVESSTFQESNQDFVSNETLVVEGTVVTGGTQEEVVLGTATCETMDPTIIGPIQEGGIYGETVICEEITVAQSYQQETANIDTTTYGEMALIDCGMVQQSQLDTSSASDQVVLVEETGVQEEFITTETSAYVDTNATMLGPFHDEFFYEETGIVQESNAEEALPATVPVVQTAVSHEAAPVILETSQSTAVETSFIVETGFIETSSSQGPASANATSLVNTVEVNHATPAPFEEPANGVFCIEVDIQASSSVEQTGQTDVCKPPSGSGVELEATVSQRPPQQSQGSGFSIETESISSSTQQESIHEEAFIIETASYVEMSPMVPNTVQHSSQVVTPEPTPVLQELPQQTFVIEDAMLVETETIQSSAVELSAHDEVDDPQIAELDTDDATKIIGSQEGNQKESMSLETVSVVVSPPEETAERQSWIIEDAPQAETRIIEQNATILQSHCVEVVVVEETEATLQENTASEAVSPLRVTPPATQAFAIDAGSNPVEENTTESSGQEVPIQDQDSCPTPEEEMPYNSPISNPHLDEHELFFNVPSKQPTEEKDIIAQTRARKDTLAHEQLKEFIQSQALIFQAASIIEKTTPESENARSEQVNAEKPIPIPPPPPYPPPLRLPKRNSWVVPKPFPPPEIPLKKALEAPREMPQEAETSEPAHTSPTETTSSPTKTLKTILSEAIIEANSTPAPSVSSPPLLENQDVVFELPALNDAREEPNIIEMTAQEQFAMAMFASGEFLGDDLGYEEGSGRVVEEEGNMLPEVRVG